MLLTKIFSEHLSMWPRSLLRTNVGSCFCHYLKIKFWWLHLVFFFLQKGQTQTNKNQRAPKVFETWRYHFFKIKLWWLHRLFLQKGNPSEIKLTCFRSFWNMLLSPFIMQIGLFFRFSFLEKRQLFLTPFSKYLLVLASRHGNYTIFFWIAVNACICWESDVGTCNILKHSLRDQI